MYYITDCNEIEFSKNLITIQFINNESNEEEYTLKLTFKDELTENNVKFIKKTCLDNHRLHKSYIIIFLPIYIIINRFSENEIVRNINFIC